MIGYSTMREALIWVQTDEPATVHARYRSVDTDGAWMRTAPVTTAKGEAFVAKLIADQLEPGTTYTYEVYVDGERQDVAFREDYREGMIPLTLSTPPNWRFVKGGGPDGHEIFDFTVAFGTCNYVNDPPYDRRGRPYGADYQIFEAIYEQRPDMMLWLGDNVYMREADWTSRSGFNYRWTKDRSIPELRPLLATTINYATWDDHEYGPNDVGYQFWNKATATEAFNRFWGNPSAGLPDVPGIFTFVNYGDINIYLLDNRTYRTPAPVKGESPDGARAMFGRAQIDWLVDSLKYRRKQAKLMGNPPYPTNFNIIAAGTQWLSSGFEDNHASYREEHAYLMRRLVEEGIGGVIFLSGDVHYGEVTKRIIIGGENGFGGIPGHRYTFYDITSSPLTAGPWAGHDVSKNPSRVDIMPGEADRIGQRNFATLTFTGPLDDRVMTLRYFDSDGTLLNYAEADTEAVHPAAIIRANDLAVPTQ